MSVPTLDSSAAQLNLQCTQGDPLSFKFIVDADWSGSYVAQVRVNRERTSTLLATLTVVANLLDAAEVAAYTAQKVTTQVGHTEFTITLTALLNTVPPGTAWWDMQQQTPGTPPVSGVTRLAGRFIVIPDVTVL